MAEKYKNIVEKIDQEIRQNLWFDFHLWRYDGVNLVITGSDDLSYYHKLEIIFTDVFYASTFFNGWKSNTEKPVIEIPSTSVNKELNERFEIEQGYQVFIIRTEDYKNDIYIAAKEIDFNLDTVYYYFKEDLKSNERLADFVTRE